MSSDFPTTLEALQQTEGIISTWFGADLVEVNSNKNPLKDEPTSFALAVSGVPFIGLLLSRGDTPSVSIAIKKLAEVRLPRALPLVVVPFMGETGRRLCEAANVSWVDLSGNAKIRGPKLFIHVGGNSNAFLRSGRHANVFAAKSSRVARQLLMEPSRYLLQAKIAELTGLGPGYTSKIVNRLEDDRLLERHSDGGVRPRDPELLLEAWRERYDFFGHRVIKGTIAARSGVELLPKLQETLADLPGQYAATGLAAAWQMTKFANFRTTTFYVESAPSEAWKKAAGFREGNAGANVWLVIPNDEGVFAGKTAVDSILCVHPVQAYLDVLAHPERSEEAAEVLRDSFHWRQ